MDQIDFNRVLNNIRVFLSEAVDNINEAFTTHNFKKIKLKRNAYFIIAGFFAFVVLTYIVPSSIRMIGGMGTIKISKASRSLYSYNSNVDNSLYLLPNSDDKVVDVIAKSSKFVLPISENPVLRRIKESIPSYITELNFDGSIQAISQLAISKQVIIYFFPYRNMELFYSFYDNIIIKNGLWNSIIYVTNKDVYQRLVNDKIPSLLLEKEPTDQGLVEGPLSKMIVGNIQTLLEGGYSVVFIGADVTLIKPLPRTYSCYDCDIHIPSFRMTNLVDCYFIFHPTIMTLTYMHEIYSNPSLLVRLYETKEESGIIIELLDGVISGAALYDMYNIYRLNKENEVSVLIHNDLTSESDKLFRYMDLNIYTPLLPVYYHTEKHFLIYDNTYLSNQPGSQELRLYNAIKLSRMMNRILILPMFNCGDSGKKCSFGDMYYGGKLIEHMEDVLPYSFTYDPHVNSADRTAIHDANAITLEELLGKKDKYEISHMSESVFRRELEQSRYISSHVINLSGLNEYKLENIRVFDNLLLESIVKRYAI